MATSDRKPILPSGINPKSIRIVAICEALPENPKDYFYASSDSPYVMNTLRAFTGAGSKAKNIDDLLKQGIYLTVAVKEPKKTLTVPSNMIETYSHDLENELALFPNTKAILLMGDTAIRAMNCISKRIQKPRVIPAGSTYRIRGRTYYFGTIRVFPSYLPTGKNFLIEKTKRIMVSEDIKNALAILN